MTRLAILADIHGNLPALLAVHADLRRHDVEYVIVAGDTVNWGPSSREVLELVTREGWAIVRGNNEFYLLDGGTPRAPAIWSEYTMIPWLQRQLGDGWRTRIAAWPDSLCLRFPDAPPVRVVHGSPRSPWEGIFPSTPDDELAEFLAGLDAEETTLVAAHTHLALDRRVAVAGVGRRVLNPGSVGLPLDGRPGAQYLLLEAAGDGWHARFQRVGYDSAPLFEAFERSQLIDACGAVIGQMVIDEFRTNRVGVAAFVTWQRANFPGEPIDATHLARFTPTDWWDHSWPDYRAGIDRPAG